MVACGNLEPSVAVNDRQAQHAAGRRAGQGHPEGFARPRGGPTPAGLRTVFGIPERSINDEQDRGLPARAEAHLKLLDEEGLVEADPFHIMPAGG